MAPRRSHLSFGVIPDTGTTTTAFILIYTQRNGMEGTSSLSRIGTAYRFDFGSVIFP
jgi:hypothetical protein